MSEETKNTQQPTTEPTPGVTGGQDGARFTQEDVNRIVSERLAKEREKAAEERMKIDPIEQREKELAAREAAVSCKEYIAEKNYPAGLLEVLDTSDTDKFKAQADKLLEVFPQLNHEVDGKTPVFTRATSGGSLRGADPIAEAFRPQ